MKSKLFFLVISLAVLCYSGIAYAGEEITLTTYYPAPYGEYNSLSVGDPTAGYTATNPGELLVEGNIGIGTTSPGAKLDVRSVIRVAAPSSPGSYYGELYSNTDATDTIGLRRQNSVNVISAGTNNVVYIGSTDDIVIASGGNVGIGTASPGAKLELAGSDTVGVPLGIRFNYYDDDRPDIRNGVLAMGFGAGGSWWGGRFHIVGKGGMDPITGGNLLQDGIDGTHILTIDPATGEVYFVDGNVGIGTTSPQAKLDVDGDGDTIIIPRKSTTGNPDGGQDGMIYYNDADEQFRAHQNGSWQPLGGMDTALFNTNGYTILPSGLIIQWGVQANYTQVSGDHLFVMDFPIPFPNAVLNVTAGMMHQAGTDLDASVSARVINNSQVELQLDEWSGTTNWIKCTYMAIGY